MSEGPGSWRVRSGMDVQAAGDERPVPPPPRGTVVLTLRGPTHRDFELRWSVDDPSLSEEELLKLAGEAIRGMKF